MADQLPLELPPMPYLRPGETVTWIAGRQVRAWPTKRGYVARFDTPPRSWRYGATPTEAIAKLRKEAYAKSR
jgi:hypothetical protein